MTQIALFSEVEVEIRMRTAAAHLAGLSGLPSFILWHLEDQGAFGIEKAVSIATIQNIWENTCTPRVPTDRSIKDAVKTLLEQYDIPIGSCRIPGKNGYYFITSDSDADAASRPLKAEIFSMFRRLKVISPKSSFVKHLQGQIQLLQEEPYETVPRTPVLPAHMPRVHHPQPRSQDRTCCGDSGRY